MSYSSVDAMSLDLHDAALLHRDPPAERSRLATRRFVAAAAKQWFTVDGSGDEILCAQIMITRFASAVDASLAQADSWSELHAGNAVFHKVAVQDHEYRVAVVSDAGVTHTLAYGTVDDVAVAAFSSHGGADGCIAATARLLSLTLRAVATSNSTGSSA